MQLILLGSIVFFLIVVGYYGILVWFYKKTTYYSATHRNYLSLISDKGAYGEYLTYMKLKPFEKLGAKFLFNCYLPKDNNETVEIDVMMIYESGIYVFESKNYSGWIFGSLNQKTWTQTLPNGRRVRKEHFLNPIIQNKYHIQWLKKQLDEAVPLHSVIVFSERCTLKDVDVYQTDVRVINRNYIQRIITDLDKSTIGTRISKEKIESIYMKLYPFTQVSEEVKQSHIQRIKMEVETPKEVKTFRYGCPKCGSPMVLRTTNKGENKGKQFYGCSKFPKCRGVREI